MKHSRLILLAGIAALAAEPAVGQDSVDYKKYPDYTPRLNKLSALRAQRLAQTRPAYVNNAETPYFPGIINQVGGSCGSASRIAYMFAYEINRLRGVDGSLPENQYPTHFTWLLTNSNSSKDGMAIANGIPNSVTYGGRLYSTLFGIQDCSDTDFGWMQGYDKWFAAMHNRLERTANFPLSVETEEGREAVKQWLWNHSGDPNYPSGGICGFGVASGGTWKQIPSTEANNAAGVTGKYYVGSWGKQVDHALTIVGYDDRIEFDLDGNGIAGERDKDEVGAWIVANSWGTSWCNNGFIYCPYKNAVTTATSNSYYYPEVYIIRRDYRPLRTLRIKMDYTKRSELKLSAGIASDLNATEPERTVEFEHFKFAGDGNNDGVDAETPMLGRWNNAIHNEPMEFGYDLTDLTAGFNTRKPLKYFFIIESKKSASGIGTVHNCDLIDYEFEQDGIETPFDLKEGGVTIQNRGSKTIITAVVSGEPVNAPRNVVMADGKLRWDAPENSSYKPVGYAVYRDDTLETTVPAGELSYTPARADAAYQVAATYAYSDGKTFTSDRKAAAAADYYGAPQQNQYVRRFTNSGLRIKDLFKENRRQATIEYWLKPIIRSNYNQQVGPGWEKNFLIHTSANGQFSFGWNTSNRFTAPANTLPAKRWKHIAIVVDGNAMHGYVNGELVGTVTSNLSGIGGFGDLDFGTAGTTNGLSGEIDEIRVWSTARSQREIQAMMYNRVADPAHTPGLLAELPMDEAEPADATGHFAVEALNAKSQWHVAGDVPADERTLTAAFSLPGDSCTAGVPATPENLSSGNAVRSTWTIDGNEAGALTLATPSLIFPTAGKHTLTLTVEGPTGETASTSRTINVTALATPTAGFDCVESIAINHRINFTNTTTPTEGTAYEWLMPGAENERAATVNAAATYTTPGTYTVTLKATNAAGTTTVSRQITVTEAVPEPDFSVAPPVVLKGTPVRVTAAGVSKVKTWTWTVSNEAHHDVYKRNRSAANLTLSDPGVYTLRLDVATASGNGSIERPRAITVCNADAVTGLNFSGSAGETVTFSNPLDLSASPAFTFDWWMYAKKNADPSQHIGGTAADFMLTTRADGALVAHLAGQTYETGAGYVAQAEWHHYAVSYADGHLNLYKDGRQTHSFETPLTSATLPALPKQLKLGGAEGPMNAVIDELRIWNTALSTADLRAYANAPIDKIDEAVSRHALKLYYDFNQSSGNVTDRTPNGHTGTRSGFGPEGDAWTPSLGAFCLSLTPREDVTFHCMTNYQAPFINTGSPVNAGSEAARYVALLTDDSRSTWQLENATEEGSTLTSLCVDQTSNGQLALITGQDGFAGQVTDHKLYQTMTLDPGHYVFGTEALGNVDAGSYLVVAAGRGLPATDDLEKQALAAASLSEREVSFSLYEASEVSLGLLMNTHKPMQQRFNRFYLERKATNEELPTTGMGRVEADASGLTLSPAQGGVSITAAAPTAVRIYSLSGVCVYRGTVSGTRFVMLPAGFYVAGGHKFIVR